MNRDLTVLLDDNGVYTDETERLSDFLKHDVTPAYVAATDSILLGLYKPFYSVFVELSNFFTVTQNTNTIAYWNGTAFTNVDIHDETQGFSQSDFISWERDIDDWEMSTIDGKERYWVQLKMSVNTASREFRAINLVFSSDNDLVSDQRQVTDFLASGDTSFIAYHVSARNEIIQNLRNSGKYTKKSDSNKVLDLGKWDINRPDQIRQASKYLVLSKIMFDVSSEIDDKYYQKWRDYMSEYQEAMRVHLLSLDSDDDGVEEVSENRFFRTVQVLKV